MKRVVVLSWKTGIEPRLEIFSNLKLLCGSYPNYSYNTLNNYLSKSKIAYENDIVKIERQVVHTKSIVSLVPGRKIAMVGRKVKRKTHDDEAADKAYWLSRPVSERLDAVTRLRAQFMKKAGRMDRTHIVKRKLRWTW